MSGRAKPNEVMHRVIAQLAVLGRPARPVEVERALPGIRRGSLYTTMGRLERDGYAEHEEVLGGLKLWKLTARGQRKARALALEAGEEQSA